MGRRKGSKKKRSKQGSPAPGPTPAKRKPDPVRRADPGARRPDPPWGSVPLSEVLVLSGIAFLIWGFVDQNSLSIGVGLILASLGGLELTVREHVSGYRSHTLLLASAVTLATLATSYYLIELESWLAFAIGAVVFLVAFTLWRRAFRSASGGYSFRIGGFKG